MRQPGKPRWKRWILAATAAISMAGAGAVMTTPDVSVAPPPSDAQNEITISMAPVGVPTNGIAGAFNDQAQAPQMDQNQLTQMARDAALVNDLHSLRLAVERGYDLHEGRDTLMRMAVIAGSHDIVQYTLMQGADVNADKGGALETAVVKGNLKMVELLVANGADVNINDSGPLFWTVLAGQHTVANYLIDHGAKVTTSMMVEALAKGDKTMVDILSPHAPSTHVTPMFPPVPPPAGI